MSEVVGPATVELLTWISSRPRTYPEAMEAWRSNCPRLSIWEDALVAGLVQVVRRPGRTNRSQVILTPSGRAVLDAAAAA
jgi:hypothetical protein